jgi:hypothetical protein
MTVRIPVMHIPERQQIMDIHNIIELLQEVIDGEDAFIH